MRTILVSAYGCEPLKGSEQGVGWNWVLQMARQNKIHVITRANNQKPIEAHLPEDLKANITFHYYDTNQFIKGLKNKAKGLYLYYFFWQLGIIPLVVKLKNKISFDYSLHLTFGSLWMPTFLPIFNIPFIWGPVGGADSEPESFRQRLPFKKRLSHNFRSILIKTSFINPLVLFPAGRARSILTRTQNTRDAIPSRYQNKVKVVLETGIEEEVFDFKKSNKFSENSRVRIISTGRLMASKNLLTAIIAIGKVTDSYSIEYSIIGSGPEKSDILNKISELGLKDRISIKSEIPRNEVLKELEKSDIYLFPSLREGGSWALMEAMAVGLPVVCLKWSGMEVITDEASAFRLPVTDPEKMAADMADAINKLLEDPVLRKRMGDAGRRRIKEKFNWEAKGQFMNDLLDELDKANLSNDHQD